MVNDLLHFTWDRDPQLAELPLRKLLADVEAALAVFRAESVSNSRFRRSRRCGPIAKCSAGRC